MLVPTGVSMPPPTPCNRRNTISDWMLQAAPHSAEPIVKTTSANRNVFFVPKWSPIQPEAGIQMARLNR